jgi:hypothetical protein
MTGGDTLAQRYERTLLRIKQIEKVGYRVKIQSECKFDETEISPELLVHPIIRHSTLITRNARYGGRAEAIRLHYKIPADVGSVQYCDIMSLYPYICKYFKIPVGHPINHVEDACKDKE